MRKRTVRSESLQLLRSILMIWIASSLLVSFAAAQKKDIAVVVNPNNSVTNISFADLRKLFSGGKRTWPGGPPVKLIVRAPGSRERLALLRILAMSESEYKQYWTAQIFRGEVDAEPFTMPSFGMVKEAIKVFPGAISLVDPDEVKAGMDLRVIKVEGHLPGEEGYPVH
jgi:ABC-type phosphate transport system substrate-binding protein